MDQYSNGHTDRFADPGLAASIKGLPPQPAVTSERIKSLLGRALLSPETLSPEEVREIAASVVFHLLSGKAKDET